MNKDLLAELVQLPPVQRIDLVHDLWDSISSDNSSLDANLRKLTSDQRVELAMDLWDSIAPEDMPPLTPDQIAELGRRVAEHEQNPGSAIPWVEVQARLRSRLA